MSEEKMKAHCNELIEKRIEALEFMPYSFMDLEQFFRAGYYFARTEMINALSGDSLTCGMVTAQELKHLAKHLRGET